MRELYENIVKDRLRMYEKAKVFLEGVDYKIQELESKKDPKLIGKYGIDNSGKGISLEDLILNINAEIELLKWNKFNNETLVNSIENSISDMTDEQREITMEIYGRKKRDGRVYELMDKYNYEKSQIYRIANEGLKHISLRLYGNY